MSIWLELERQNSIKTSLWRAKAERESSFGFRPWYGVKALDRKGRHVARIYASQKEPSCSIC